MVLGRRRDGGLDAGPSTVRADLDPDDVRKRMADEGSDDILVTTPDGVLLGVFRG